MPTEVAIVSPATRVASFGAKSLPLKEAVEVEASPLRMVFLAVLNRMP